jgi:hypothetical protein
MSKNNSNRVSISNNGNKNNSNMSKNNSNRVSISNNGNKNSSNMSVKNELPTDSISQDESDNDNESESDNESVESGISESAIEEPEQNSPQETPVDSVDSNR